MREEPQFKRFDRVRLNAAGRKAFPHLMEGGGRGMVTAALSKEGWVPIHWDGQRSASFCERKYFERDDDPSHPD